MTHALSARPTTFARAAVRATACTPMPEPTRNATEHESSTSFPDRMRIAQIGALGVRFALVLG